VPIVFQEEFMTSTIEISERRPQFLVSTSNVDQEVQGIDLESADEEEPNDVDVE